MRDPESGQARRPDNLTLANWDSAPNNRWAYQHISDFLPTVPIGVAIPMPLAPARRYRSSFHPNALSPGRRLPARNRYRTLIPDGTGSLLPDHPKERSAGVARP